MYSRTKEEVVGSLAVACVLSLSSLAILSRKTNLIYYRRLFPFWKPFIKLIPNGEGHLVRLLGRLFRVAIKPIPSGSELRDYPALHAAAEERGTDVALRCSREIANHGPLAFLSRQFPRQCLQSFAIKNGLASSVHHTIRGVRVLRQLHPGALPPIVVVEPGWSESLTTAVESELMAERVTLHRVGPILGFLDNVLLRGVMALSSLLILGRFLGVHGVALSGRRKTHFRYVTELMDPECANSGPQGNLWFVDQNAIKSDTVMAFLTAVQKEVLGRYGVTNDQIAGGLKAKDFCFVSLEDYPLTLSDIGFVLKGMTRLMVTRQRLTLTETIIWNRFIRHYLTYAPLFSHFRFEKYIHSLYPNGRCAPLDNSGLITGLCENMGAMAIGYQARSVVCASHEEVFDTYHVYLSWHDGNFTGHADGLGFMGRTVPVGNYAVSGPDFKASVAGSLEKPREKQVLIFPSELEASGSSKYSPDYSFRLLSICAGLAEQHPEIQFIVKFKDPTQVEQVPRTPEFDLFHRLASENLSFAGTERHAYRDLMARADIVIALGYTTPGLEALILKKPTIIYSELETGGPFFNGFIGLVATSPDAVKRLFLQALNHPDLFLELNSEQAGLAPVGWSLSQKEHSILIEQL